MRKAMDCLVENKIFLIKWWRRFSVSAMKPKVWGSLNRLHFWVFWKGQFFKWTRYEKYKCPFREKITPLIGEDILLQGKRSSSGWGYPPPGEELLLQRFFTPDWIWDIVILFSFFQFSSLSIKSTKQLSGIFLSNLILNKFYIL